MRIAIDARMIRPHTMHGIARYVYNLLDGLESYGQRYQFFIFVNEDSPLLRRSWPVHMKLVKVEAAWISFREQWQLPKVLRELDIDLFHAPSFIAPLICPCRLIMTIHDLNHIVLSQFYTLLHQFYYQLFVRSCIRQSEYIVTVSNFSKNEIIRNLRVNEEKVFVTYNGVSEYYRRVVDHNQLEYVRDIYELPEKFIFCVSNNKPHKNVHQLVRAYCVSKLELPLVLACASDRAIIRTAERYGKKHLIYFVKFIEEEHLPSVYTLADLFVYPSTYEGFGLPPLEAIACGIPVVVANSSSLPEVVEHNAIFADPYDVHDMARALEVGVLDQKWRERLVETGPAYAKKFSWHLMAKQTLEIYDRCMGAMPVGAKEVQVT